MRLADRLLERLADHGLALPRVPRVRVGRETWLWRLEAKGANGRWASTTPAVSSRFTVRECVEAPRLLITGDGEHLTVTTHAPLSLIPRRYKPRADRVTFARWDETWHVLGPAPLLPVGGVALVDRFTPEQDGGDASEVIVGEHVAERLVRHTDRDPVRYVIARIDRGE